MFFSMTTIQELQIIAAPILLIILLASWLFHFRMAKFAKEDSNRKANAIIQLELELDKTRRELAEYEDQPYKNCKCG